MTLSRTYAPKSWISPKLSLGESAIHGKGVIAIEEIVRDEVVIVWGGAVFTRQQIANGEAQQHTTVGIDEDTYLGTPLGTELTIDDWMNHSCTANIWMLNEVTLAASRRIAAGEELTADYAIWLNDENYVMKRACNCRSKSCRGTITGKDWRLPEVQRANEGRFAPFLIRRIDLLREAPKS